MLTTSPKIHTEKETSRAHMGRIRHLGRTRKRTAQEADAVLPPSGSGRTRRQSLEEPDEVL